jgi:hypothetical protein
MSAAPGSEALLSISARVAAHLQIHRSYSLSGSSSTTWMRKGTSASYPVVIDQADGFAWPAGIHPVYWNFQFDADAAHPRYKKMDWPSRFTSLSSAFKRRRWKVRILLETLQRGSRGNYGPLHLLCLSHGLIHTVAIVPMEISYEHRIRISTAILGEMNRLCRRRHHRTIRRPRRFLHGRPERAHRVDHLGRSQRGLRPRSALQDSYGPGHTSV